MASMSHRYPQEMRKRAIRLVAESREEYESGVEGRATFRGTSPTWA